MKRSTPWSWLRLLASVVLVSCAWGGAAAQLKGHNISGDFGLSSGTQAPPGIYLVNANWIYPTDTIKNDRGDKINQGRGSLTSSFVAGGLSYVTDVKILGGTLGGTFIVPVIKNRIQTNALNVNTPLAFSDIYWQPAGVAMYKFSDARGEKKREYEMNVSAVAQRQGGKWQFVILHYSNLVGPPAGQ